MKRSLHSVQGTVPHTKGGKILEKSDTVANIKSED